MQYHNIRKGESLGFVAYLYNTTIDKLISMNNIKDRDNIYPGQRIRVK